MFTWNEEHKDSGFDCRHGKLEIWDVVLSWHAKKVDDLYEILTKM